MKRRKPQQVIVVRLLRHGEKPIRGETVYPLSHCHHGRWRSAHAVRTIKR